MAAGQGFKNFSTGDVLTSSDVNGYLMQGVWVFANAAARTSAVTSPQEGNVSFLKDTNSFEIYDGAAWIAYGTGDITGVTAGTGISGGGTSGDVTITNSMATAIDAKGDLIAGTGSDTFSRLAVGTNDHVLTADSSTATGLKWAAPSSGSLTQLATGSLSSTSLVISGFSSAYTDLVLKIYGAYSSTISTSAEFTVNSIASYNRLFAKMSSSQITGDSQSTASPDISNGTTANEQYFEAQFMNYSSTSTRKQIWIVANVGTSTASTTSSFGYYFPNLSASTAITTITFKLTNGGTPQTLTAGTYILYGRK